MMRPSSNVVCRVVALALAGAAMLVAGEAVAQPAPQPGGQAKPSIAGGGCPEDSDEIRALTVRVADLKSAADSAGASAKADEAYWVRAVNERGPNDPETVAASELKEKSATAAAKARQALKAAEDRLAGLRGKVCPRPGGATTPVEPPVEQPKLPSAQVFTQTTPTPGGGVKPAGRQCPDSVTNEQKVTALADNLRVLEERHRTENPKTKAAQEVWLRSGNKAFRTIEEIRKLEDQIQELLRCPPDACPDPAVVEAEIAALQRWLASRQARIDSDVPSIKDRIKYWEDEIEKKRTSPPYGVSPRTFSNLSDARSELTNIKALENAVQDRIRTLKKLKESCPPRTETPPPETAPNRGPIMMLPGGGPRDGLYAGGTAGWAHLGTVDAVTHLEDGSATDKDHHAEGFAVGGRAGIKDGPWRYEGEFSFRRNGVSRIGDVGDEVAGSTQAFTFLGNAIYDLTVPGWVATPHLGAGIGVAHLTAQQKIAGFTVLNSSDTQFAYQGIAGVRVPIAPGVAFDLDYRYLGTTEPSYRSPTGNRVTSSYGTHNVVASVTFSFAAPSAPPPVAQSLPEPRRSSPAAAAMVAPQVFVVAFDPGRSAITRDGARAVAEAVAAWRAGGSVRLDIADAAGTAGDRHLRLAQRRAAHIAQVLASRGVPHDDIAIGAEPGAGRRHVALR